MSYRARKGWDPASQKLNDKPPERDIGWLVKCRGVQFEIRVNRVDHSQNSFPILQFTTVPYPDTVADSECECECECES
jgi:hypothetical protein